MIWFVGALCVLQLGVFVYIGWLAKRAHDDDLSRMYLLCDNAMGHLRAHSLTEKAQVDAQKAEYDVRLQMLRDTIQRGEHQRAQEQKPTKTKVKTLEGEEVEVDPSDLEIF